MARVYDVIIIGGGPAGLAAAIQAARLGLSTLVLEASKPGGKLLKAPLVENYPGFPEGVKGSTLAELFMRQAERLGAEIRWPERVIGLEVRGAVKEVMTIKDVYRGLSLIIAVGAPPKDVIEGEGEYLGRGVSYCMYCDAPLYKGKDVAVVWLGGDLLDELKLLSRYAKTIYVVSPKPLSDKLGELHTFENVAVLDQTRPLKVVGERHVTGLEVVRNGERITLNVRGVFIVRESTMLPLAMVGVEVNEEGFIVVDRLQRTNIKGVYAAGDCTGGVMQVASAVGEGVVAATQAYRYVTAMKASMSRVRREPGLLYIEPGKGARAYLTYKVEGDTITVISTYTPPEYRGLGLASRLMEELLMEARRLGVKRIKPACSYAKRWLERRQPIEGLEVVEEPEER